MNKIYRVESGKEKKATEFSDGILGDRWAFASLWLRSAKLMRLWEFIFQEKMLIKTFREGLKQVVSKQYDFERRYMSIFELILQFNNRIATKRKNLYLFLS